MTEELIRLLHLEKELGEAEMIFPLLAAEEFNQAKQTLDTITDAIEALRAAGFGPFTGRPFIQDAQPSPDPVADGAGVASGDRQG